MRSTRASPLVHSRGNSRTPSQRISQRQQATVIETPASPLRRRTRRIKDEDEEVEEPEIEAEEEIETEPEVEQDKVEQKEEKKEEANKEQDVTEIIPENQDQNKRMKLNETEKSNVPQLHVGDYTFEVGDFCYCTIEEEPGIHFVAVIHKIWTDQQLGAGATVLLFYLPADLPPHIPVPDHRDSRDAPKSSAIYATQWIHNITRQQILASCHVLSRQLFTRRRPLGIPDGDVFHCSFIVDRQTGSVHRMKRLLEVVPKQSIERVVLVSRRDAAAMVRAGTWPAYKARKEETSQQNAEEAASANESGSESSESDQGKRFLPKRTLRQRFSCTISNGCSFMFDTLNELIEHASFHLTLGTEDTVSGVGQQQGQGLNPHQKQEVQIAEQPTIHTPALMLQPFAPPIPNDYPLPLTRHIPWTLSQPRSTPTLPDSLKDTYQDIKVDGYLHWFSGPPITIPKRSLMPSLTYLHYLQKLRDEKGIEELRHDEAEHDKVMFERLRKREEKTVMKSNPVKENGQESELELVNVLYAYANALSEQVIAMSEQGE